MPSITPGAPVAVEPQRQRQPVAVFSGLLLEQLAEADDARLRWLQAILDAAQRDLRETYENQVRQREHVLAAAYQARIEAIASLANMARVAETLK